MKHFIRLIALLCCVCFFLGMTSAALAKGSVSGKVVILGDDILNGKGLFEEEDHFDSQLEDHMRDLYHADFDAVTIAQDGGTTISSIQLIPHVMAEKPDLVIVAVGYNDALHRTNPDIVYNNLDTLLRELDRAGAFVMLVGIEAPQTIEHSYASAFNNVYPKLAQRYRVLYHNGFMKGVEGDPKLTQANRYHPNRFGVAKIIDNISPGLHQMLKQIKRMKYCTENSFAKRSDWCKKYVFQK